MSLKINLLNSIINIDLVGNNISLRHNSHGQIKTITGGIITILILIFSLYCIIYFGQDIIQKEKPISYFSKDFTYTSKVSIKDFPFILSPVNSGGGLKTDFRKNIGVDVLYYELYADEVVRISRMTVEDCDPNKHFGKHYDILNATFPLDISYCLNLEKIQYSNGTQDTNEDIFFQNEFGSNNSTFIILGIRNCNNQTEGNCASQEDQNKFFEDFYLMLIYADSYINLNDYHEPNKYFVQKTIYPVSTANKRTSYLQVKNTYIKTDIGFIMEDINELHALQVNPIRTDISTLPWHYSIVLESTKITDNYNRRYVKVQDLIANIGGLIKFLFTFSSILMYVFSHNHLCIELSKELFTLSKDIPKRQHSQANLNSTPSIVNDPFKKSTKEIIYTNLNNNLKDINTGTSRLKNLNLREAKISFCDYLSSVFLCRSNVGRNAYVALKKIINEKLELKFLLKNSLKVDAFYKSILTEEQKKMVNEKPRLYETKEGLSDMN
jgi:hypothetical protein